MRAAALSVLAFAGCGDQLPGELVPSTDAEVPAVVSLHYVADPMELTSDLPVYFQNADGSLVSAQRTNTDGRANAFMAPGGSVTLVLGGTGSRRIWTYLGVAPGDELLLDLRTVGLPADPVSIDLRIPRRSDATSYQLFTTCGQASLPTFGSTIIMLAKCARTTDMVIVVRGGTGAMVGALLALDIPITKSDVVMIEGEYGEPVASTVTVVNAPPGITGMAATHGTLGAHELLYTQRLQFAPGSPSLTFTLPPGRTGTLLETFIPSTSSQLFGADWRDALEHTVFDLGVRMPLHDGIPSYTTADRTIRWNEQPGSVVPDLVIAGLVFRSDTSFDEWQIVGPRTAAPAITLPALPDRRYEPGGTATVTYLLDAVVDGGYAAGRERVLGRILSRPWPMEGPSGRALYQVTPFSGE